MSKVFGYYGVQLVCGEYSVWGELYSVQRWKVQCLGVSTVFRGWEYSFRA